MDESSANRLNQKLSAVISELESDQSILKQNIAVTKTLFFETHSGRSK